MDEQAGPRFCAWCGAPRTPGHSFCGACGKPYEASPAPKRRARTGRVVILVSCIFALILVAAGGAFAYTERLFASPKAFLLHQMDRAAARSGDARPVSGALSVIFSGLDQETGPLQSLNGQAVNLGLTVAPAQHQLHLQMAATANSKPVSGSVYVDDSRLILEAASLVPLLGKEAEQELTDLPQYLVIADNGVASSLQEAWRSVDESARQPQPAAQAGGKARTSLAHFVLQAVPDRYFHRDSLTRVTLSFDQAGLEDIVRSIVAQFYDQPDAAADILADLSGGLSGAGSREEIRSRILRGLNAEGKARALKEVADAFGSGDLPLAFDQTTFTAGWSWSGGTAVSLDGRLRLVDGSRSHGAVAYRLTASPAPGGALSLPALNKSNSMTLEAYVADQRSKAAAKAREAWTSATGFSSGLPAYTPTYTPTYTPAYTLPASHPTTTPAPTAPSRPVTVPTAPASVYGPATWSSSPTRVYGSTPAPSGPQTWSTSPGSVYGTKPAPAPSSPPLSKPATQPSLPDTYHP